MLTLALADPNHREKRSASTSPWKIIPLRPLPLPRPHSGQPFEKRSIPPHSPSYLSEQQRARRQSHCPSNPSCKAGISWISACGRSSVYRCHGVDIDRRVLGIAGPVFVFLARPYQYRPVALTTVMISLQA